MNGNEGNINEALLAQVSALRAAQEEGNRIARWQTMAAAYAGDGTDAGRATAEFAAGQAMEDPNVPDPIMAIFPLPRWFNAGAAFFVGYLAQWFVLQVLGLVLQGGESFLYFPVWIAFAVLIFACLSAIPGPASAGARH